MENLLYVLIASCFVLNSVVFIVAMFRKPQSDDIRGQISRLHDRIDLVQAEVKKWPDVVDLYTKALSREFDERLAKYEYAQSSPHSKKQYLSSQNDPAKG